MQISQILVVVMMLLTIVFAMRSKATLKNFNLDDDVAENGSQSKGCMNAGVSFSNFRAGRWGCCSHNFTLKGYFSGRRYFKCL